MVAGMFLSAAADAEETVFCVKELLFFSWGALARQECTLCIARLCALFWVHWSELTPGVEHRQDGDGLVADDTQSLSPTLYEDIFLFRSGSCPSASSSSQIKYLQPSETTKKGICDRVQ